jgi:hypothetical protein
MTNDDIILSSVSGTAVVTSSFSQPGDKVSRSSDPASHSRLGRIVVVGDRGGETGDAAGDSLSLCLVPERRDVANDEGPADTA